MLISLKSLTQSSDGKKPFEYSIDLSGENVNYDFPFKTPVIVRGVVEDKSGAVFFDANAEFTLTLHCSRCCREFTLDRAIEIHYLLNTAEAEGEETEGMFYLGTDVLDTDEIIIPELIMSVDMSDLCHEDCKGLCVKCGSNLNETSCNW